MCEINLIAVPVSEHDLKKRCCCNCGNNLRIQDPQNFAAIQTRCAVDHHYISYTENFEGWCHHWRKHPPKPTKEN